MICKVLWEGRVLESDSLGSSAGSVLPMSCDLRRSHDLHNLSVVQLLPLQNNSITNY